MESNSCINVEFWDTAEDSFYFEVVQQDFEEDDFRQSKEHHWSIESRNGFGYLILNQDDTFVVQTCCVSSSEKKLCIRTYRSSSLNNQEKLPVMIYTQKNDQTMVVCCKEHKIQAVPMMPPTDITGTNHDALFYQTELPGTKRFKFVFSVDPKKVLGVVKENDLYKLTLLDDVVDVVDTRVAFVVK
ncbi:uncharacterized protein LOC109205098 isoform X2 [Oreochromis niloticus]|uniref:uncharacterized protein LOC109205098 isoform X2 n=1 Tax=Oreochromis niloticus TaxID=8128 RepID=UPI000DF1E4E0|nr:uncharacterized protein LOC109205098 isoform X2 [Oreochromis niloticus]